MSENPLALLPAIPISGEGRAAFEPIWADDVARCVVADLDADGENELVVEVATNSPGRVATFATLEDPGDGDADLVFVRSGAAAKA